MSKPQKKNNSKKNKKIKVIPKGKKEIEEISLEKKVEEEKEVIEIGEFQEFFRSSKISAPVLNQVGEAIQEPLEINLSSVPINIDTTSKQGIDYATSDKSKYSNNNPLNEDDKRKYEGDNIKYEIETNPKDFAQKQFQRPQNNFVTSPLQAKEKEDIKFLGKRREDVGIDAEAYKDSRFS